MRRDLLTSLIAVAAMTVVLGLAYPLAITAVSQLAFSGEANGSLLKRGDRVVGSSLIGQEFEGRAFFHSRPSATEYSGDVTFFANVGPNSLEGRELVREDLAAYLKREKPFDRGLSADQVPVDAVTRSASGVDPQISVSNARIQAHRVAATRGLPLARVRELVDDHTEGRGLGLFGEPGVTVLQLNLALEEAPRR
jgi:potassium-transporting ATPase KdpC subunit